MGSRSFSVVWYLAFSVKEKKAKGDVWMEDSRFYQGTALLFFVGALSGWSGGMTPFSV